MRIHHSIFLLAAASLIFPASIKAQNNAALTKEFRDNFERGCNQGKTPGVDNQKGYCTCMANSFQARYSGVELAAISRLAAEAKDQGPILVNIMIKPEAKTCSAKY